MGSEKTEKALQTLKKWRDEELITKQKYEEYSTKALDLFLRDKARARVVTVARRQTRRRER